MRIFALSDPHLSLGVAGKEQDIFGECWHGHAEKIAAAWRERVREEDLVLVPGDVSWAMRLEEARPDLEFLGGLPGVKVLCRGNHDYWWPSLGKVRRALPASVQAVQADAIRVGQVGLCGTRLWDVPGLSFGEFIDWKSGPAQAEAGGERETRDPEQDRRIYQREMTRLRLALDALDRLGERESLGLRVVLLHYPPCCPSLAPNEVTALLERHGVDHVVFGHLHGLKRGLPRSFYGTRAGVTYHLTSCDYLEFKPVFLAEMAETRPPTLPGSRA